MSLCPEPDCAAKMRVEKTTTTRAVTVRIEACPAGHRWETESVVTSTRKLPATKRPWTKVAGNLQDGNARLPATSSSVDESCGQPVEVAGNPGATFAKLPATREAPPKVAGNLPKLPATGAWGVRGGLPPVRNSEVIPSLNDNKRGGDPERADAIPPAAVAAPGPDRPSSEPAKQERPRPTVAQQAAAVADPGTLAHGEATLAAFRALPTGEDPRHPRSAHGLLALFGRRWEAHEKKLWLKQPFDDRNADQLVEAIREAPDRDDQERAFEEVIAAVETYLRIDKPFYAGHPFGMFVKELPALRVGDAAGLDRLRRTKPEWEAADRKHQRAAAGTRESEPTPPPVPNVPPPRDLTDDQRAELEAHRAQLKAQQRPGAVAADARAAAALRKLEERTKTNAPGG